VLANNASRAMATEDEEQILGDYAIWKKNSPFLYDLVIAHALTWPSLTAQWLPGVTPLPDQECVRHRLLLGTHTDGEAQNAVLVADVLVPDDTADIAGNGDGEKASETGIEQATKARVRISHELAHEGEVNRARYMPQNPDVIATKTVTGDVCIYNLTAERNSEPLLVLKGHQEEGYGLAWNTQCQGRLLSCSSDSTVCMWDVADERGTMDPLTVFKHHEGPVGDVSWHSKDAHTFASVGDDKLLILYDARLPPESAAVSKVVAHQDEIHCVAFHPAQDTLLATGSADHTLGLFDTRKLEKPLHVMAHHSDSIYQISWNPHNQSCIASSAGDRRLMIWDLSKVGDEQAREDAEDGPAELLFVHGGHTARIQDFSWNPNKGSEWMLASVADDNILQVYTPAAAVVMGN